MSGVSKWLVDCALRVFFFSPFFYLYLFVFMHFIADYLKVIVHLQTRVHITCVSAAAEAKEGQTHK